MREVPEIGNWLIPRHGVGSAALPGMVVAVLPSGRQCILARRVPPHYRIIETVHETETLKGPMTGKVVSPDVSLASKLPLRSGE